MLRGYGSGGSVRAARFIKRVRSDSDDNDDVLLPFNGKVAAARAFLSAPELKYFDTYLLATDVGESATLSDGMVSNFAGPIANTPLFNPGLGDAPNARNDRRVLVRSWHVKLSLQLLPIDNGTKIPQGITVFVALIQDKQTNSAVCAASDVFVNQSGDQNLLMCLQRNPFRGARFDVLRSERVDMTPNDFDVLSIAAPDQTATSGRWEHLEFFIPLDVPVNFKNNGSTHDAIIDNSWHIYAVRTPHNDILAEIHPPVRCVFTSRFRFIEAPV